MTNSDTDPAQMARHGADRPCDHTEYRSRTRHLVESEGNCVVAPGPGSHVVITGANAGIGLATAVGVARTGATVVLAVRSLDKGRAAVDHITGAVPDATVDVMHLDLASLVSVREFAAAVTERFPTLDVLVNNAGVAMKDRTETVDGFETTFGVNHLGHFLLTNLLRSNLAAAADGGRVVVVASDAHKFARGGLDFDDLMATTRYRFMKAYGASKLANLLFTHEAARRWADDGITVNAVHPGFVATRIGRDGDGGRLGDLIVPLLGPFARTPEKGARTSVHLATAPDVAGVTGQYFVNSKPKKPAPNALDDEAAQRLWSISEELVGLA